MTEQSHDFEDEIPEGIDLVITSTTEEEFFERTAESLERLEEDREPQDHYRNLADPSDVQKLLSSRRLELIVELLESEYDTISAVADALDRDYKSVHDDLDVLAEHGIVRFDESAEGRGKRPYIPYENVRVELELAKMHKA
jgi:predicted transcriptional regulator